MEMVRVTIERISGTHKVEKVAQCWDYSSRKVKPSLANEIAKEAVHALVTPRVKTDDGE